MDKNREKMIQIFEVMADFTLTMLNKANEAETIPDEKCLELVSTTLQLYVTAVEDCL